MIIGIKQPRLLSLRSLLAFTIKLVMFMDIDFIFFIRCSLLVARCSLLYSMFDVWCLLFKKRFIKSASKTDLFYFLWEFKRYETAKCPKRTERSINVQWTFIANGPACARCLDTIVKYLVGFKKIKVRLDFLNTFWSSKKVLEINVIPYLKWSSILRTLIFVVCYSKNNL